MMPCRRPQIQLSHQGRITRCAPSITLNTYKCLSISIEQPDATRNRQSNLTAGSDQLCSPVRGSRSCPLTISPELHLPLGQLLLSFPSPFSLPSLASPLHLQSHQMCEAVLSGGRRKDLTNNPQPECVVVPTLPSCPLPIYFLQAVTLSREH